MLFVTLYLYFVLVFSFISGHCELWYSFLSYHILICSHHIVQCCYKEYCMTVNFEKGHEFQHSALFTVCFIQPKQQ